MKYMGLVKNTNYFIICFDESVDDNGINNSNGDNNNNGVF